MKNSTIGFSIKQLAKVKFKKIHSDAQVPFRKHGGDAGFDLFAVESAEVCPGETIAVHTGICLKLPKGYYCEIHTRSSHGMKGVRNHLGIVDEGYHGEITVLMNSHNRSIQINKGDRVGQLIFKKRIEVNFVETNEEFESSRGTKGFGSTGK